MGIQRERVITIKPMHIKKQDGGDPLTFPTIVTQYEDRWSPRWRSENVYGRMDPMGFYAGTGRELTLGFRIISEQVEGRFDTSAELNMVKLQKLIQYQYPTYTVGKGVHLIKAPPYFKIKMMNVTSGQTDALEGYISGPISINPGFQDKTKAQFFNGDYTQLYFSDVEIVIKMQVLHSDVVGNYAKKFESGKHYPYNVKGEIPPDGSIPPGHVGAAALENLNANAQEVVADAAAAAMSAAGGGALTTVWRNGQPRTPGVLMTDATERERVKVESETLRLGDNWWDRTG